MLELVYQSEKYDFYRSFDGADSLYNIVPAGSKVPVSGYKTPQYILNQKGLNPKEDKKYFPPVTHPDRRERLCKYIAQQSKNLVFVKKRLEIQSKPGYNPWCKNDEDGNPLYERLFMEPQYTSFDAEVIRTNIQKAKAMIDKL